MITSFEAEATFVRRRPCGGGEKGEKGLELLS